jgi:drug/metabolite transporter (DMT)-like permease
MYEIWLVTICWGLSFPLARILVGEMDPLWITAFRFLFGGVFLFFLAIRRSSGQNLKRSSWRLIIFLSVFEFFLTYLLYLSSLKYLPASKIAALTLTTPVLILLFQSLGGGRFPKLRIIIPVLLAIVGAAALYEQASSKATLSNQLIGFALIMTSNASFALASVIMRSRLQASSLLVTSTAQLLAGVFSVMTSLIWTGLPQIPALPQWGILVYLSIVATGLGFWFWNRSVIKLGALYPGLIGNLKAPIAALLAVVILKETVSKEMWLGMLFLIASASLAHKTISRKERSIEAKRQRKRLQPTPLQL